MKNLLLLVIYLFLAHIANGQTYSKRQYLQDFDALFATLKNNYPYFEINKRQNKIDWLGNCQKYRRMVKKAKNDKAFLLTIEKVISDLNSDHTDMMPMLHYTMFLNAYEHGCEIDKKYCYWVEELSKNSTKTKVAYWNKLVDEIRAGSAKGNEKKASTPKTEIESNVNMGMLVADKIGLLTIHSFEDAFIEADRDTIRKCLEIFRSYPHLILDIRGNGGGNSLYWQEMIVPYLITNPIVSTTTIAYKNGDLFKKYYPKGHLEGSTNIPKLSEIPNELRSGEYLFSTTMDTIHPNASSPKFQGKVYLWVDENVFSSAEAFAVFCKNTHFAQVVGKQTKGDGVGSDPLIFSFPNTGIIIRFPNEMGLNADGSSNAEMRTIPDVALPINHGEQGINEIIEFIQRR